MPLSSDDYYDLWMTLWGAERYILRRRIDYFVADFGDLKGFQVQSEALEIISSGYKELWKARHSNETPHTKSCTASSKTGRAQNAAEARYLSIAAQTTTSPIKNQKSS